MKPIYIGRAPSNPSSHKKIYIVLAILVLVVITVRAAAPYVLEAYINKTGADKKGYIYRVDDIDLKILKGQVKVSEVNVFKSNSDLNFIEARNMVFDLDPLKIFDKEKIFSVHINSLDVLVSKDFFEEINRVKNETKNKTNASIYLEDVKATIDTINVRQVRDQKQESIMTLKNTKAHVTDLGVGSENENTEFQMSSAFAEGGEIAMSGKTNLEAENSPWTINGVMKKIPSSVLEKLAGDKLPIDIESANLDAVITAQSSGGQIEGEIVPDIKDLKLSEDKDQGVIKKSVAKAANFILGKAKGEDEQVSFKMPFTLNENFTVNIPDSLEKVTR